MRDGSRPGTSAASTSAGYCFDLADEVVSDTEGSNQEELQYLRNFLHYPEEVALQLTDTEYQLFYQIPPIDYLRQVCVDGGDRSLGPLTPRHMIPRETNLPTAGSSVRVMIRRFNEVSAWVTEIVLSSVSEDRKATLSCILRVALTCWNIGNFNGAMEIIAGLKSSKLKSFWLKIDESSPTLDFLSAALLSSEYERAMGRALAMAECRIIPFFGSFLRELREILATCPPLTYSPAHRRNSKDDRGSTKKDARRESGKRGEPGHAASSGRDRQTDGRSDAEDLFLPFDRPRPSPGASPEGLPNFEKLYRTHAVLDHIARFHQHHYALARNWTPVFGDYLRSSVGLCNEPVFAHTMTPTGGQFENEALYDLEVGGYDPVQPLVHDHGVTMFPLAPNNGENIDQHVLQIMHHGTSAVVAESEWGGAVAQLRLERACAVLAWNRTQHRPGTLHGEAQSEMYQQPEVSLSYNPEESIPLKYTLNYENEAGVVGDEGFIDLQCVKDMRIGGKFLEPRELAELSVCARRHNLDICQQSPHVITLVYGRTLSDNRTVHFVFPPCVYRLWAVGLHSVIKALMTQAKLADRSLAWLKNKYTALYYEDGCCCEPLVSDAIRIFGGRDSTTASSCHSTPIKGTHDSHTHGEPTKTGIKFKKNKSTSELKSCSPKNLSMIRADEEGFHSAPRHSSYSVSTSHQPISSGPLGPRHSSLTAAAIKGTGSSNRTSLRRLETSSRFWENLKHLRTGSVGYDTQLDFIEFVALFRSFSLAMRYELIEVFDQLAVPRSTLGHTSEMEIIRQTPGYTGGNSGLLTRNGSMDLEHSHRAGRKKAFDVLAAAALPGPRTDVAGRVMSLPTLGKFCETRQNEPKTEQQLIDIINRHEPDWSVRMEKCLSFEGFVRFLNDKDNFAFVPEQKRAKHFVGKSSKPEASAVQDPSLDFSGPLSQYYVASSHNTYLTGHQLKGESSVELYSQVLLTGCRCVELDCWDGEDGSPVIYHGHTFTTKIPFRRVVETIARSAFVASPYPLILSIENHCSLPQQQVMASTFQAVFGEKLVTSFLFDEDYTEEPRLPSPEQLKYKVLLKNKKLLTIESSPAVGITAASSGQGGGITASGLKSNGLRHTSSSLPEAVKTSSMMSTTSGTTSSLHDYYDDTDDTDDDDLDDKELKILISMEDKCSRSPMSLYQSFRRGETDGDTFGSMKHATNRKSNQIAKELSDMVTYVQAIKFRGLNPLSPKSSVKTTSGASTMSSKESAPSSSFESSESSDSAIPQATHQKAKCLSAPVTHHPCYRCSSVNEAIAKKICRKHPMALVAHTETQLVRTYPAGLRIDSSNFDPVTFWSCGVQLVALNYQTEDAAMAINAAMFESNGCVGYVKKPAIMWDAKHIAYRRYNPLDREFDGIHAVHLTLSVVSGQYVAENVYSFYNAFVEVEILGVPADCKKIRTKVARKNALNPIWNENFSFKINFPELAFVRFEIYDADTNYMLSQRVIPLQCLRPGYRHVRLRSPTNQPLNMASLLIFSRCCEEEADDTRGELEPGSPGQQRKIHFVVVHTESRHEPYSILKVTRDTTADEAIAQSLTKAGLSRSARDSYVLVEEVRARTPPQRVLAAHERVLPAAARAGSRLVLIRVGDDPSSRAWLTSIRSSSSVRRDRDRIPSDEESQEPNRSDSFLVCVHNVSHEIPYAILKVPITATASFVVYQALTKARCQDDPKRFVLVEELEWGGRAGAGPQQRALADEEGVYAAQASWKTLGRFVLQEKGSVVPVPRHRAAIAKLQRGLSITRGAITGTSFNLGDTSMTERPPIHAAYSDPTHCRRVSTLGKGIGRSKGHSDKDMRAYMQTRTASREVCRQLGTSLASHSASLSTELGSIWDIFKIDKDRRRSAPASYEPIQSESKSPSRLARDLLQVIQDTVFNKRYDDDDDSPKTCPLVKEESGLTEEEEESRLANLIDFFFTLVKSQHRKGSGGSCFRSNSPTEVIEPYVPVKVPLSVELEQKMETLMDFLANSGCIDKEEASTSKKDNKITLMEFLFGKEDHTPMIEVEKVQDFNKGINISESNVNIKDICYIDETPVEDTNETLIEMYMRHVDGYDIDKNNSTSVSITTPLSEKSKSDVTISKIETYSNISKTKSDSTIYTQDTVIDRGEDFRSVSRRISEVVIDLSHVKDDLECIFIEAVNKIEDTQLQSTEMQNENSIDENDTMSEQEDIENYQIYTNPKFSLIYTPYSVELSDIIEEDEISGKDNDRTSYDDKLSYIKYLAEEVLRYIEDKIQVEYSESSRGCKKLKRSSVSLIDLRNIPDLPPSMIMKPIVKRVDKSTSTIDITESTTDETALSSSAEKNEKFVDKMENLCRYFSKPRLGKINEKVEKNQGKIGNNQICMENGDNINAQTSLDEVDDIVIDDESDCH